MNIPRVAVFLMAVSLLGGCEAGAGFANRYGPDPAMPTTTVVASTDHQVAIMRKLAEAANCASPPIPQGTDEYRECLYRTTLVGFNFVDEQCDAYLHELFALDKERDRAKSAVSSAGLLTNAVLAVSPASKMTMAIAAQAFGLSASFIDVATDSYLFKTNPGVIFNIVATLQAQYRDNVAANKTLMIDSLPAS